MYQKDFQINPEALKLPHIILNMNNRAQNNKDFSLFPVKENNSTLIITPIFSVKDIFGLKLLQKKIN